MPRKKLNPFSSTDSEGGVNIGHGANVSVGGDLVGRDKISQIVVNKELSALFKQLQDAIQADNTLPQSEKVELFAQGKELEAELKKPNPDLSKLERFKRFLSSQGKTISASASAIFRYPTVQETIKALAQRLIDG